MAKNNKLHKDTKTTVCFSPEEVKQLSADKEKEFGKDATSSEFVRWVKTELLGLPYVNKKMTNKTKFMATATEEEKKKMVEKEKELKKKQREELQKLYKE